MKEIVNLIEQKIEENKNLSITNQEDEQVYIRNRLHERMFGFHKQL